MHTISVICLLLVAAQIDAQTWQWGFRAGSGNTFQPPQSLSADDQVNGIGTDSLGNVYIAGEIFNAPYWGDAVIPDINVANRNGSNSYIAKLDCDGTLQWVRYIGQNNGFNQGSGTISDLAVDQAGNC